MNIEALEKLAEWLEAGAPELVFNMDYGIVSEDGLDLEEMLVETGQTGLGGCGSVCCIAGAAYLMSIAPEGSMFPDLNTQIQFQEEYWHIIAGGALTFLGLPPGRDDFFHHDLFSSDLAPYNCTPKQAAVAVRRVIAGKEPWSYDED